MKLISTLFTGDQIDVTMIVQSRNVRNKNGENETNGPLITRYKSKIGNESLIFNPSVVLTIRKRGGMNEDTAMIPLNLIYRFMSNLSAVYQQLSTKNLYHQEDGTLFIDQKVAKMLARKISLFRNSLIILPVLYGDRTGKLSKGIDFTIEGNSIGSIPHVEALGLIDLIEHLDIATYTLMAGIIDEMESTNQKLQHVMDALDQLLIHAKEERTLLYQIRDSHKGIPAEPSQPMLQWETVDTGLF